MKPKMYRWVCPDCGGGKLAPGKPRKIDVRRYCLPCSEAQGVLVERSSPALDRKREAAQDRRKKTAKATRARKARVRAKRKEASAERAQRAAEPAARARDLAMDLMLHFPAGSILAEPRDMDVRYLRNRFRGGRGFAYTQGPRAQQITVWIPRDWQDRTEARVEVVSLLLHELAHLAAPPDEHHGPRWRALFLRSVESLTGIKPQQPQRSHGRGRLVRADVDKVVTETLCQWYGIRVEDLEAARRRDPSVF